MQQPPSTPKIFLFQYATLGIYFLVWCHRLGKELNVALQRKAVPSLWWFAVPGGGYYWIWRLAESLEVATGKRIKMLDTFLWYALLSIAPFSLLSFLPDSPESVNETVSLRTILVIGAWVLAFCIVLAITLHAIYITLVQNRLNKVRQAT